MKSFSWHPLSNLSFRSKLIISNALLASAILIGMAYYLISRATATHDFLAAKLTQAVQEVTESELKVSARRFSDDLDRFFSSLLSQIDTITSALQIEMANESTHAPINASSLSRLSQGSWDNANSEPGSIFVSNQEQVPGAILSEISVVRQIDLIVPSIMEKNPDVLAVYFGSVLGEMLHYPNIDLATGLPPDYDVTQQSWFAQANPEANPTRKTICSDPYQNASLQPIITCSAPVFDVSDQFRGVVAMDIHLLHVIDLVLNIPVGNTGYALVIDAQGHIIGMPERGHADFGFTIPEGEDPFTVSVVETAPIEVFGVVGWMTSGNRLLRTITIDEIDKYVAFSPIPTMGYSLGLVVPVNEMQGPVLIAQSRLNSERRDTLVNLLMGSVVVLVVFLAALLWLGTTLTSPIVRLTRTASLIAEGDLHRVAEVESKDEIGVLAGALNLMTKNLRDMINNLERRVAERTEELSARVNELASVNSISQAMAHRMDMDGIIRTVGDKVRDIFSAEVTEILLLDESTNMIRIPYSYYRGYQEFEPFLFGEGLTSRIIQTRMPLQHHTYEEAAALGALMQSEEDKTESYIGVPIVSGDKVLGVVSIQSYQLYAFDENHVRLLSTLASNMGVALDNARLFDETQRLLKETEERNAELAIINSVQAALAAKLDLQGIYDAIGDQIRELFDAQKVMIITYDRNSNLMSYPYLTEMGKRLTTEPLLLDRTGVMDYVISEKRSFLINTDIQERTREITGIEGMLVGDERKSKSRLDVPIIVGGEACGGISLQNVDRENAFTESDMRLLQTLANAMGGALENARLFDETQRLLKETEQRNAELAIINSIGQILTEQLDLNTMVESVGEKLREALALKNIGIGIYSENENIMQVPYIYRDGQRLTVEPFALNPFNRRVSKAGRSLVVNMDAEKVWLKFGGISAGNEIPRSFVMVPLMAGRELVGGISLQDFDKENAFTDLSVELLETVASNMGTAILNARLFDETQRLLKETEQRAAELAIINSVQAGLVAQMDIQGIYDLIGNKIYGIFDAQVVDIVLYDPVEDLLHFRYTIERGVHHPIPPIQLMGFRKHVIEARQHLLINDLTNEIRAQYGQPAPIHGEAAKSIVFVPMVVGEEAKGVISLQNLDHTNAFRAADVRLLQTFANSMSVALENARLFDETQRLLKESEQRAAELGAISKVSQALVAETEVDSTIQLIGNQTREIFDADIVYVALLDPQTNLIHFPYQMGETFTTLNIGEGHTGKIIQTGEALLINRNVHERSQELGVTQVGRDSLSYLGVPIKAGGETIGVISVQSTTKEGLFNEDSLRLLTTIAANAGAAIHTARLHTETQRNASQMATIASVGRELSATLDLQNVIRTVVEHVHSLFHATNTVLRLIDSDGKSLRTALALGKYAEEHSADVFVLGQGIAGSIAQSGIAEVIDHVDLDPRGIHIAGTPDLEDSPQTLMVAPLIAGNRTIGVISVYKDRSIGTFSQIDLDFLVGLGRQAAFAVQNASLFQDQLVAREQAETLQAVTQALSRTLTLDEVFGLILAELQKVVPYNSCSVQQWDGTYSVIVGGRGFPNINELVGRRFPTIEGDLSSYVLLGRQPYILEDVSESYPYFRNPEFGGGVIHGWMGVPLIYGDRVIGMLTLDKHEKAFYTAEHAQLAMAFAAQAAVAIENARLFDTERAARQQAETQSRHMATIANVGRELSATLDLQKVIDTVVEHVHDLFQARNTVLRLLDSDGKTLRTALALGLYAEENTADVLLLGEGITGAIAQSGIAEVIDNLELDPRAVHIAGTPDQEETPQTMMVAPLIASNRTIGVLSVYRNRTEGTFSQGDLDFLVGLGRQAAIAIENSRLFNETQNLLKETEQRATELQIINNIGQTLTEGLDLQSTLERVGQRLREVLRIDSLAIAAFDPKNDLAIAQYMYHKGKQIIPDPHTTEKFKFGIRFASRWVGRSWVVNTNAEKYFRRFALFEGALLGLPKSFVMLPLLSGGEVIGGMTFANYERENAFTDLPIGMLETISSNMGTAIQNARLFDETQRLLQETEQRATELQIINSIGQTLTEGLDLDTMIERVGERLRDTLHVEHIGITAFDPQKDLVIARYFYGKWFTTDRFSLSKFKLGMRLSARGGGRSWVVNRDAEKSWRRFAATPFSGDESPKSFAQLPLLADREVIGGITIADYEKENAFTDLPIGMLETISSNMGTAIQNARLFDETKRLFKDAQEARAAAEQANKAKSTFLANMSHELRTPLNAIIGFTRIVRKKADGVLPEKQLDNLGKVLTSSEHLLGLINTVLDIAKIEAGRMEVIPAKFNLSALADQCANLATPLLKPSVTLEKQVDDSMGFIFSDQDKIKQIVLNLLSNAAKFTHEGRILLRVEKQNEDIVNISVTDSGIGISEEALGRIFEEFQQADTSTTRQYGGTGLGLAISRNLARLLGGDLTATSKLGKGSTFTLTVPVQYGRKPAAQSEDQSSPAVVFGANTDQTPGRPVSVQEADPQPGQDSSRHRVLVIDDDPNAIYFLQEGLGTSEFEVIGARTGHDGLQIARAQQPEAILLDILMPETDGWQILNDLKSDAATSRIPVILLTIVDKKALGFKLGAAEYLLKPLNPAVVLESLRRVIGGKNQARKCALVVDDDPNVAEMLRQTLPESEFALMSAEDGEAGLRAIQAQRPDVILLDLMMPKIDGFGVIERLRADPTLRDIPVIVISAKDLTSEESQKLKESVAYVMKKQGFDAGRLIKEISGVVKK